MAWIGKAKAAYLRFKNIWNSKQLICQPTPKWWLEVVDRKPLDPGFVLLGTRQQGVPVILRELVLPGGFDPVSLSFTVRDATT
ncbi:unnamed protein product [Schistosoma mattheei]|uniref:Uncharacterized protein n=1 Tax=Schistosoma mattheei TaxID=31246 RepID=A0A183NW46_9TREM|nr:unnamed protein product [Schistosoma mattheei]